MKFKLFLTLIAMMVIFPSISTAEFVRTSLGVYQHTDLIHKIVVTEKGIFFVETEETAFQAFNPEKLVPEKTSHAFISYDSQTGSYTMLSIGNRGYRIGGGFNLYLGSLYVKVDQSNPYVSFTIIDKETPNKEISIMGVYGTTVVVNIKGPEDYSFLEANNFFNQYKDVVKDYSIKKNRLFLDNKVIVGETVGITVERKGNKNICFHPETILLSQQDVLQLAAWSKDKKITQKRIMDFLKSKQGTNITNRFLVIHSDDRIIAGIDYSAGDIKTIRETKRVIPEMPICVIEDLKL